MPEAATQTSEEMGSAQTSARSIDDARVDAPRERGHFARGTVFGEQEIVHRQSGFVRATLHYNYGFTSNARIALDAELICAALDEPAEREGVWRVRRATDGALIAVEPLTVDGLAADGPKGHGTAEPNSGLTPRTV